MARRFEGIRVGDQLLQRGSVGAFNRLYPDIYWIVTDLWFDPVRGQHKRANGEMVAVQQIGPDGKGRGRKTPHTIRGLAANGFERATMDYADFCAQREAARQEGTVVNIRFGAVIRKRPKLPGGRL